MLGHLYPLLGRWEDAVHQFEISDQLSRAWVRKMNTRMEDEWHLVHNLILYGIAEHVLGRLDLAEQKLKDACSVQPYPKNCVPYLDFLLTAIHSIDTSFQVTVKEKPKADGFLQNLFKW